MTKKKITQSDLFLWTAEYIASSPTEIIGMCRAMAASPATFNPVYSDAKELLVESNPGDTRHEYWLSFSQENKEIRYMHLMFLYHFCKSEGI